VRRSAHQVKLSVSRYAARCTMQRQAMVHSGGAMHAYGHASSRFLAQMAGGTLQAARICVGQVDAIVHACWRNGVLAAVLGE
jgi:hypothetical protein